MLVAGYSTAMLELYRPWLLGIVTGAAKFEIRGALGHRFSMVRGDTGYGCAACPIARGADEVDLLIVS